MPSLAQEEADRLLNHKERIISHPADRFDSDYGERDIPRNWQGTEKDDNHHRSDDEVKNSNNDNVDNSNDNDGLDDDLDNTADLITRRMMSMQRGSVTYHVPTTIFEANTGPKGVISDAQSYERAKQRTSRRTFGCDLNPAKHNKLASEKQPSYEPSSSGTEEDCYHDEGEGDEDAFMRKWRQARMEELLEQQVTHKSSPRRKRWGKMETVGANGYLDAIEQTPGHTVVVVCIYDPESAESAIVEDSLINLARKQYTTRFIKLHHEIAEMDHITAPAILAYKGGEVFATIVDIFKNLPAGRGCSSASLGDLLMEHRVF
ncbi:hypothetical protein KEM54_000960 [Ascosphaera aggregata]|nr:hypothetical protein KEM54_000960 [Ascosphaera aggregata]